MKKWKSLSKRQREKIQIWEDKEGCDEEWFHNVVLTIESCLNDENEQYRLEFDKDTGQPILVMFR